MINDKFLTVSDVAKKLSLNIHTVYRLVNQGKIRHLRIVDGGTIRITESALNNFIHLNTK